MLLLVLLLRYFYFCSCLPRCSCNHCPAMFCHICPHFPSREEQRPVLKHGPYSGLIVSVFRIDLRASHRTCPSPTKHGQIFGASALQAVRNRR
jgi:hypothetical protein